MRGDFFDGFSELPHTGTATAGVSRQRESHQAGIPQGLDGPLGPDSFGVGLSSFFVENEQ